MLRLHCVPDKCFRRPPLLFYDGYLSDIEGLFYSSLKPSDGLISHLQWKSQDHSPGSKTTISTITHVTDDDSYDGWGVKGWSTHFIGFKELQATSQL